MRVLIRFAFDVACKRQWVRVFICVSADRSPWSTAAIKSAMDVPNKKQSVRRWKQYSVAIFYIDDAPVGVVISAPILASSSSTKYECDSLCGHSCFKLIATSFNPFATSHRAAPWFSTVVPYLSRRSCDAWSTRVIGACHTAKMFTLFFSLSLWRIGFTGVAKGLLILMHSDAKLN